MKLRIKGNSLRLKVDFPIPTQGYGRSWNGHQRPPESGVSVRTLSGTHTALGWTLLKTPIAVQQKMMRHTDIRTTMNIYGDVVTDEMSTAGLRVA